MLTDDSGLVEFMPNHAEYILREHTVLTAY